MTEDTTPKPAWREQLTERELKEVQFAQVYTQVYNHGTAGHTEYNLIAKLAKMLDEAEQIIDLAAV